jgi:hypothetical protein
MGYVKQIIGAVLAVPSGFYVLGVGLSFAIGSADLFLVATGLFALIFFGFGAYLIRDGRRDILKV